MLKPFVSTALLAAALSLPAIAIAAPQSDDIVRTKVVRYGDLDLGRAEGAGTLYARLVSAARSVCAPDTIGSVLHTVGSPHCVADAIDTAVATVNAPTLTEYFLQKRGIGASSTTRSNGATEADGGSLASPRR